MRDSSLTREGLERLLSETYQNREKSFCNYFSIKLGRTPAPIPQTVDLPGEFSIKLRGRLGFKDLIVLLILYHYSKKESNFHWQIFLALEEYLENKKDPNRWISLLLEQSIFLDYLQMTEYFTKQSLLSLLSWQHLLKILENHFILVPPRFKGKVRRKMRRRGYRDKGSTGEIGRTARRLLVQESSWYSNAIEVLTELDEELNKLNKEILLILLHGGAGNLNVASIEIFHLLQEDKIMQKYTESQLRNFEAKMGVNRENLENLSLKIKRLEEQRNKIIEKQKKIQEILDRYANTTSESKAEE